MRIVAATCGLLALGALVMPRSTPEVPRASVHDYSVTSDVADFDVAPGQPADSVTPMALTVPLDTASPEATDTPSPGPTDTPSPVVSDTPSPAETDTPTPAATDTASPAASDTPSPAASDTPSPAASDTPSPAATDTPTPGASASGSPSAAPTTSPDPLKDCPAPVSLPVPDGQPIVVSMAPAAPFTVGAIDPTAWRHPWVSDQNWRMHFEGLTYLPGLAARAYVDGQAGSLGTIVGQVAAFHSQNPDPGTAVYGWDEGTAQRRLETENCLFSLTHDQRLVPGMAADAAVQLGSRYYGPPWRVVHNHGLMANLRLIRAAELLGVDSWRATALARMRVEAPLAFSSRGTTWEQSSAYQAFNVGLWNSAADVLAQSAGYSDVASAIRAVTAKGQQVVQWFTEPDGKVVQIGDSDVLPGAAGSGASRYFRDDQAGYVVGRWSWTDRASTYYTLRYGPRRRAHGHLDRGSITWSTAGMRVLVGPGRYEYNFSPFALWKQLPAAHNVAIPSTGAYRDSGASWIAVQTVQGRAHGWLLKDTLYPRAHTRAVTVNASTRTLSVLDTYAGAGAFRQMWHLDPAWTLISAPLNGRKLVFRHPSGHTLTILTSGRLAALQRGSTTPIAGWNFPMYGVSKPAYQISLSSVQPSLLTVFLVR